MILQTKYFGEIEYEEGELIQFPNGLPGFEEEHAFLLLPFNGSNSSMFSLQSATTPSLAFVAMDPFLLDPNYEPVLSAADLRQCGVEGWQDLSYCVLCVVKEPASESTVNMKCPIALHLEERKAYQVIMETDDYGMRHPLVEFQQKWETSTC